MSFLSRLRAIKPHLLLKSSSSLRHAGGGHGFEIEASNIDHFRAKNLMHMYGVTPMLIVAAIAGYKNLTEGEAILADTPPGYKPHYFEYEKYPMTRWFARVCRSDPTLAYERFMFVMEHMAEVQMLRKIHLQVDLLMRQKKDYFNMFNRYHSAKYSRIARDVHRRIIDQDPISNNAFPNFVDQ